MTTCPVCNKPVDPLRARFVAVRDGKVVPYCSPECRDSQSSKPTQQPAALAPRAQTPAVGIPLGAPRLIDTARPSGTAAIADLDSGPVIEIVREPASGVVTRVKDERVTQPTGKIAKQDLEIETTKPRADHSKSSGGKDSAAVSGEVVEAKKRARTRPSGKHLTRDRRDSTEAKAGWDWLDDEPAENARPGTTTEGERKSRWPLVVLLVAAVGGGGAYAAYHALAVEKQPAAEAPPPTDAAAAAVVVEDAPSATKEAAVSAARKLLLETIANNTSRVQGLAAAALGRTGDPAAVAWLQTAIKTERVTSSRFRFAYALARAGDMAGRDVLAEGLKLQNRSDKIDAANKLALLDDPRAVPMLRSLLAIADQKLGAAEMLARFKDADGLRVLEQVLATEKDEAERRRAMIALYRAGKTNGDDVRELLDDKESTWRSPAIYALAEVGKDPSVKMDLVDQVTHATGSKVRAALALRKLAGDATDEALPALLALIVGPKDQEQVAAAEAVLILAGEPQWAEVE